VLTAITMRLLHRSGRGGVAFPIQSGPLFCLRGPLYAFLILTNQAHNERGGERKRMTINEAIISAVKEGYHVSSFVGIDMYYSGADTEWSVWTRRDNESSYMARVEESFLDPKFWRALGRALGWDRAVKTLHVVDNGRPTIITSTGQSWLSHWHSFLDFLAEGKTPADFFAQLDA